MRRETSDYQTADWQCAGKRIPLLTTGNIVQGDFGASLRCARNDSSTRAVVL